jgi:hypothetical protein
MKRPPPWRQRLDRFIPENTPLGRGNEVDLLLRATGGSPIGAAVLAAIARKESSFGKSAFVPNNFWGYGIHAGPSVNRAPSVEAMATRVWKALKDPEGYYYGEGRYTLPDILMKYAPPSENNTRLYQQQTSQWLRELGYSPNTNVFTGATVPTRGATQPGMKQAGGGPGVGVPQTTPASVELDWDMLNSIFRKNQADIFAGRSPDPARLNKLLSVIQQAIPVASPQAIAGINPNPPHKHTHPGEGVSFHGTYGLPTGGVDSGKVFAGGVGSDWAGSMPRALHLAKAVGGADSWTSQKRSRKHTASGGISDHWVGSTSSYAIDLGTSGSAGDKLFRKVINYLNRLSGGKVPRNTKSGSWHNFTVGGYRYQIGWRVAGHYDHIHIGVKKV